MTKKKRKVSPRKEVRSRKEYEILQHKKIELETQYRTALYDQWDRYLKEFGLPENCGLYEA